MTDLRLYEIDGGSVPGSAHGWWEAYRDVGPDDGSASVFVGSFDGPAEVCERFGGSLAWIYTLAAYNAWLDETGEDPGDGGGPDLPELCYVRRPAEVEALTIAREMEAGPPCYRLASYSSEGTVTT